MNKKAVLVVFLFLSTCFITFGQDTEITTLNDGPYIFIEQDKLVEKHIVNGEVVTKNLDPKAYKAEYTPEESVFKTNGKIAALSDIHGQYDLAVDILKNNKIIDEHLNWSFGKGHFVIVGDIFDRGDKVNEMLWLIYKLEQQALQQGGKVHFVLGNHEYMILHKDLRYLHKKYELTSELLNTSYDELYGNTTVLGRWLRSKPTILKINNITFVHGGISKDFLSLVNYNLDKINNTMRTAIDRSKDDMKATDFYATYFKSKGPIWYRGYFTDNLEDKEIVDILTLIKSKEMVVGHCSNEKIVSLYNHKIFGVDSSIKNGKYGELLFIINNKYYRATKEGKQIRFD